MLLDFISFPIFIISFSIGLFFVYILGPNIKTIYIYPTPENVDKILFKDKADNCFTFEEQEMDCPSDPSKISTIPLQV
jgi:hypothetical protein